MPAQISPKPKPFFVFVFAVVHESDTLKAFGQRLFPHRQGNRSKQWMQRAVAAFEEATVQAFLESCHHSCVAGTRSPPAKAQCRLSAQPRLQAVVVPVRFMAHASCKALAQVSRCLDLCHLYLVWAQARRSPQTPKSRALHFSVCAHENF